MAARNKSYKLRVVSTKATGTTLAWGRTNAPAQAPRISQDKNKHNKKHAHNKHRQKEKTNKYLGIVQRAGKKEQCKHRRRKARTKPTKETDYSGSKSN